MSATPTPTPPTARAVSGCGRSAISEQLARAEVLEELAARCEAAKDSDIVLDCCIFATLYPDALGGRNEASLYARPNWTRNRADWMFLRERGMLHYTASLDAAAALVPGMSLFTSRTLWNGGQIVGFASVSRYELGEFGGHPRLYWVDEHQSSAAKPALALTAAALRSAATLARETEARS